MKTLLNTFLLMVGMLALIAGWKLWTDYKANGKKYADGVKYPAAVCPSMTLESFERLFELMVNGKRDREIPDLPMEQGSWGRP